MASLLSRALFRHHSTRNNFVRSLCTISTAQQSVLPREAKKQLTERRKKVISTSNFSLDPKKIPLVEDLARKHETQLLKKNEGNMHSLQKELVEVCPRGKQGAEKKLKTDKENVKKKEQNFTVKGKPAEAHSCEKETKGDFTAKKKDKRKHQKNAEKERRQEQEQTVVVKRELAEERLHEEGAKKDATDRKRKKWRTKQIAKKDKMKDASGKKMKRAERHSVALASAKKIVERNRKRFYYKEEGLPLPAALVTDESVTQELVSYASKTTGVSDKDIPLFSANPSILGVTQSDLNNAFMKLCKAGFKKDEAAIVLPHYPTIPDFSTIYKVCKLLRRHKIRWKNLISDSNCKYSFLHGTAQLQKNLMTLRVKFCLSPAAVEKLLLHLPMLFCCVISEQTIATYIKVKAAGFNNHFLRCLLADSLECWPAKISPFGPEAAEIVALLRGLNMNPNAVLARYPHFFGMKASSFASLIKQLSSAPLYVDTPVLRKAIITTPHLVKEMASHEESTLQNHFKELHELYEYVGKHLFNTPALLSPSCHIHEKLEYLRSLGFTKDETRELVKEVPSLLVQDIEKELKPRMELLLRLTDGSTQPILAVKSNHFLAKDLGLLQARVEYAQNHKVDFKVSENRLHKLFVISEVEFTKMCEKGHSTEKEEGLVENNHTSDK